MRNWFRLATRTAESRLMRITQTHRFIPTTNAECYVLDINALSRDKNLLETTSHKFLQRLQENFVVRGGTD